MRGLAHLKRLTSLSALDLSRTEVSDACLSHLKGMTSLKTVELSETKITDTGANVATRTANVEDTTHYFFPASRNAETLKLKPATRAVGRLKIAKGDP